MKYSAEALSRAGDKYLGRPYSEMDCQAFIEQCLEDVGVRIDLKGSNAWYRKCLAEGWAGTPEECVKAFGCVPKGAFLFILAFDGGEEKRGYRDGKGNASHIGLKTGRGKGAIHSGASRGCVAESEFHDRTVKNGGWNQVGLWNRLDYGKAIGSFPGQKEAGGTEAAEKGGQSMRGRTFAENGRPVNLRKGPGIQFALADRYPVGTAVRITGETGDWYAVTVGGRTGWIMKRFVRVMVEGEEASGEDPALCTVTIPHLPKEDASLLRERYPLAEAEEEKGAFHEDKG